jgi:hypothetical protein
MKNVCSNKLENLEETIFYIYMTIQKLNKEESNHINRPITYNEIEAAIKSLQKKEKSRP